MNIVRAQSRKISKHQLVEEILEALHTRMNHNQQVSSELLDDRIQAHLLASGGDALNVETLRQRRTRARK